MNFYKRFVGDFQAKTGHLSLAEVGAYDRLLDHYYATERRLPDDVDACCRITRAMTKEERKAVESVLKQFFELDDGGYSQSRADEMIAEAQPKIAANRTNGVKGGRPKKQKPETEEKPTGFPLGSETEPTGFPLGSETEPNDNLSQSQSQIYSEANASGGKPPKLTDPDEIIFGYGVPLLTTAGTQEKQARSFLGGLRKQHGDTVLIDKLRECIKSKPLQPLEWLAAAMPPKGARRTPAVEDFSEKTYEGGLL